MKKYTHHISAIALLLLVLSMLVSACARGDHSQNETETSEEKVITSGQLGTEPIATTAETTVTVTDADGTTTSEAPVTTTANAPTTSTTMPTTTTTAPITTPVATVTTTMVPVTTPKVPVTTDAPVTTTKELPTTTKAPVTTTAPHTHSYSAWKTTKEATCTADGTQTRTCACGKSETKTIEATGHSYGSWKTTKDATCTAKGEQTKTCVDCGKTKTQSIDATGHSYGSWTVTKAATESAEGEEARTCKSCQKKETRKIAKLEHEHSYGAWTLCSDYINEEATCKTCGTKTTQIHYATEADERLIADRVIYYVNKYRAEEGTPTATKLERLTLVAEMRSEQLVDDFSHSTTKLRECLNEYQYGEHEVHEETRLDPETFEVIYTGNILDYYEAPVGEAINASYGNSNYFQSFQTIDTIAKRTADSFHNSPGHWRYVGGSSPYMAVGMAYSAVNEYEGKTYFSNWFCALFTCSTAEYE